MSDEAPGAVVIFVPSADRRSVLNFHDRNQPERDVVVSGVGAVTGAGLNVTLLWNAVRQQQRTVRELTANEIDHHQALTDFLKRPPAASPVCHGEVLDALAMQTRHRPVLARRVSRWDFDLVNSMVMLATLEALQDAHLESSELDSLRVGCVVGTSKPSLRAIERFFPMAQTVVRNSPVSCRNEGLFSNAVLPDAPQRACSDLINATFNGHCPVAACATGLIAVLQGAMLIHQGLVDVCLVGSADASARASVMAAFHRLGVLSRHPDPSRGCRPFDKDRDGFHIGEGAGILVLESAENAARRKQTGYGRITQGAWLTDSTGLTQVDESGDTVFRVLSGLGPGVSPDDLCSVHGTGTLPNDACELAGIRQKFGSEMPHLFGIKGSVGHLLGAAGSVELIVGLLSLKQNYFPATTNLTHPMNDLLVKTRKEQVAQRPARTLIKLSLGFGGHVAGCQIAANSNAK